MDMLSSVLEVLALLALNLAIGVIGFIPSFLVTGLNINLLGLTGGIAISLFGEIFGAILGFYLYRYGFSKVQPSWKKSRFWHFMHSRSVGTVFFGILLFRLIPFIPSGLVTAGASLTPIRGSMFFIASSLGKIPAVLVEVAAVYGFTQLVPIGYQYAAALFVLAAAGLMWMRKRKKDAADSRQ
ncbi:TVP38/TMEM64 family protein [Planococcus sp. 1R117A]|uniref:TVP38/TMEM64 family protein n=1 Tax=Planococcus sp. 1R117A TaxID=3447020 RepID=UPI003EDB722D